METINIMTSCDDKLAPYILPQIVSIGESLKNYKINLFLFHYRISPENIALLKEFTEKFDNISLTEVVAENTELYSQLATFGYKWPPEAYFSICCWDYLPAYVDRILYIDAGDVIIIGDISEYYFDDFEGKSLIVTFGKVRPDGRLYDQDDLFDVDNVCRMSKGTFNSGVFVINVKELRNAGISLSDVVGFAESVVDTVCLSPLTMRGNFIELFPYFGDQGLISLLFAGDIKYFGYAQNKDYLYMPYNFDIYKFYDARDKLWYKPKTVHYTDNNDNFTKPWKTRLSDGIPADSSPIGAGFALNPEKQGLYGLWWDYCKKTPVYETAYNAARVYARTEKEGLFKWITR
jgi:lipopolysaccharide biosynthesis glycosyltransferase